MSKQKIPVMDAAFKEPHGESVSDSDILKKRKSSFIICNGEGTNRANDNQQKPGILCKLQSMVLEAWKGRVCPVSGQVWGPLCGMLQ